MGGAAKLMTASYDGSVRCLDPVTASFDLLVTDSDAEFSALDCLADASSGLVTVPVLLCQPLPCSMMQNEAKQLPNCAWHS